MSGAELLFADKLCFGLAAEFPAWLVICRGQTPGWELGGSTHCSFLSVQHWSDTLHQLILFGTGVVRGRREVVARKQRLMSWEEERKRGRGGTYGQAESQRQEAVK